MYWAIVEGAPQRRFGQLDRRPRAKTAATNRASVAAARRISGGKEASVEFRVLERWPRAFQAGARAAIRAEAISFGCSLHPEGFRSWEISSMASRVRLKALDGGLRIALHARQITFTHPTRREPITIVAPVPADWPESLPGWPESGCGSSRPAAGPRK